MQLIINLLVSGIGVFIASYLLSSGVHLANFITALVVAVVLGIANAVIKPVLLILTLPINVITLGLFTFVVNALIVLLVAFFVDGFKVDSFWWALAFSIVLSIVNFALGILKK